MSDLFKGASLFNADEIKVALDNFRSTQKVVSDKVQECKNELKSRPVKRWLRKDTNEYEVAKHDMHVMNFFTWASYLVTLDMIDDELAKKAERINVYEIHGIPQSIKTLLSNGTRDCYLNPDQAMFINEWSSCEK